VVIEGLLGKAKSVLPVITAYSRDRKLVLSYAQQRLWFLEEFSPGSALYNIPIALNMRGILDKEALEYALNSLIKRHESLRTVFYVEEGQAYQSILPYKALSLESIDLRSLEATERSLSAKALL
jgi:hypothetical protein